jgi:hypothetical protein
MHMPIYTNVIIYLLWSFHSQPPQLVGQRLCRSTHYVHIQMEIVEAIDKLTIYKMLNLMTSTVVN